MDEKTILLTIVLMAVVTVLPRVMPIWVLAGKKFPQVMILWLKYVPIAVLSAILAPELLLHNNQFDLSFSNLFFWISIPTFLIAILTKNLFATILVGMGGLALIRFIL